ncbi:MAG TPA: Crp/Fnr family transcriptional regulator [Polyangiaceae bacterium]|nr:Crp/Fnr family transcriptional regulator [Polyangiaceae bacterium]
MSEEPSLARFGRDFEMGDVLFEEGRQGDHMFVVQSGKVRITKRVGPRERTLAVLGAGEFVGEMAILNGKPRTATATMVEAGRCLIISAKTLEAMVAKNSEIALRLIKKLASRLDAANALVEILMHHDPRVRVIRGLERWADAAGEASEKGVKIGLTTAELADDVGVDRVIADEVIARLKRLRLLQEGDGTFFISDVNRLEEFLEFLEMPGVPRGAQ